MVSITRNKNNMIIIPKHPNPEKEKYYEILRKRYDYDNGIVKVHSTGLPVKVNDKQGTLNLKCNGFHISVKYEWIKLFNEHPDETPEDVYIGSRNYVVYKGKWMPREEYSKLVSEYKKQLHVYYRPVEIIQGPDNVGRVFDNQISLVRELGLDQSNVSKAVNCKQDVVGGYMIRYIQPKKYIYSKKEVSEVAQEKKRKYEEEQERLKKKLKASKSS